MVIGYTFRVGYIYRADCKKNIDWDKTQKNKKKLPGKKSRM